MDAVESGSMTPPQNEWLAGKFVRWCVNGREYHIHSHTKHTVKIARGAGRYREIHVVLWDEIELL